MGFYAMFNGNHQFAKMYERHAGTNRKAQEAVLGYVFLESN